MKNKTIYNNMLKYLKLRNWALEESKTKYNIFIPPNKLNFEKDFRLYISNQIDKRDFESNIVKTINTISRIYYDNTEDLLETIIENKQILEFHFSNENIKDEKPPIAQFENFLNKIKNLLYETASFTVLQKPHIFEKKIEESERYLNFCKFIKNEKGSLITKVELPNEEDIKFANIFESSVKGHVINQKLFNTIEFVNNNILVEEFKEPTDEFLKDNKENISVNITEKIKDFYKCIELSDIDLELKSIVEPKLIQVKNLTENKISNLSNFTKEIKRKINECAKQS